MEDGVWRTVGGRRIFIKDGQSLSDAMKASGKFKKSKHSLLDDEDHNRLEISKEMHKAERKYDRLRKLEDLHKDDEQFKSDLEDARKEYSDLKKEVDKMDSEREQLKEKYMNISEEERVKAYEEGKNWKDFVKERESKLNEDEVTTKAQWKEDYGDDIESLERDLKESEMYLDEDSEGYAEAKKSLENGKEYLNELKSKSDPNIHNELLKEKQDRLSKQKALESDAKKYVDNENKTRDDYIKDKMKQGVRAEDSREAYNRELEKKMSKQEKQIGKALNNEENKYSLKQIKEVYKEEDYTEVINTLSQREISKMNEAQYDMDTSSKGSPTYNNAKDYIERMENKAASKWLDMQEKERNKSDNSAYKKAFQEYKKKHPNSKITLNKFIDMSE